MAKMTRGDMPKGIKRQGGQNREPVARTGAGKQFKQRGAAESGAVERGAPRLGRPGGLKRAARKGGYR